MVSGQQPRLLRRMKWWRNILLVGSLLFIAIATLTPAESTGAFGLRPDFWCLACGTEGGADVTLNIALFVPLGIALALLRVSPLRALAVGLLLSMTIESAQRFGFPVGRVASVSDLLTNSLGTLFGALMAWHHRRLIRPSASAAAALSMLSVIIVVSFLTFTAWALGRDSNRHIAREQVLLVHSNGTFAPGYGWYHGRVSQVSVNGTQFRQAGDGPVILRGSAGNRLQGELQIDGRDERREFVPFLSVQGTHPRLPEIMMGQRNNDALLHVRLRGSQLRLPGPSLVLTQAFVAPGAVHRTVRFAVTSALWTLSSTAGTQTLDASLPVSLSLGWTLFQTVIHVGDPPARIVTLLWLFVLWLPVGYWCAIAGKPADTNDRNLGNFRRWQFVAAAVIALLFTLWLVPRAMGIAATLPHEWGLSIAGLAVGVFLATRFYHYIPAQ